ncbi:uncharacterized protein LOC106071325 [Biomphalaria glabrata]|uniref:Uncharacterized protein LOC106071325 n=1 Tax=Biomphalaria glabrata TaxID=6526 RepID=A0A9U8EHE3_BIOGL|nr:uncharacterized protein LOC106071325 [Biomphalaria glabrata]
MKTWITLGLVKRAGKKNRNKYFYVFKRKTLRLSGMGVGNLKTDFKADYVRKVRNPLTEKINYLHAVKLLCEVCMAYYLCHTLPEFLQFDQDEDRELHFHSRYALHMVKADLEKLRWIISSFHDDHHTAEEVRARASRYSFQVEGEAKNTEACPCSNALYHHYFRKLWTLLTKENAKFSSMYATDCTLLRNKRTYFQTLTNFMKTLSVENHKTYEPS